MIAARRPAPSPVPVGRGGPPRAGRPDAGPVGRLVAGLVGLGVAGAAVRRGTVGRVESDVFRVVNRLPDSLAGPTWVVMQGGNLAAVPAAAAAALAAGRPVLARRLLLSGASTWAAAKVVKSWVGRPRPDALLADSQARGRPQSGLGFVSGHAGVAAALCAALSAEVGPAGRRAAVAAACTVGLARLYVGAHLPLDVIGGASLGVAVEAAVELGAGRRG